MENEAASLFANLNRLHTTGPGAERIRKNLGIAAADVVACCRRLVETPGASITQRGKNWYVSSGGCLVTVNASSFTIITARKTGI